ncbi:MAG: efflux RND transporter periplasmic adaptor subunit [Bacteroidota bacterium]
MNALTIRRLVVTLVGLTILAGGYYGMNWISSQKETPPERPVVKQLKTVSTRTVENGPIITTLDLQGQLQAYNKIALFAEVGGTIEETGRPFKVGTYFPQGSVLLRMDDQEARFNLQAQRATLLNSIARIMPDLKIDYPAAATNWEAYLTNLQMDSATPELPEVTDQSARLFIAGQNIYTQYYTIKSLEDRLAKYSLYAPFGGVLTSTSVDQGAVVRAGQQIGELMATGYFELVATVPLSQLDFLRVGAPVQLYSNDLDGEWSGEVKRIGDQIDVASQTVPVYIGVRGRNLREGMYLQGQAEAQEMQEVAEIDRDLLLNDNEVYVVENDSLLRLHPVDVRKINRETVIVGGLPDGAELLVSDPAGAYDGMKVRRAASNTATK